MSDSTTLLIVGLGNPGTYYANTRHNAGFWLLDHLAHHHNLSFRHESKFQADLARLEPSSPSKTTLCWLLKPQTYMNRSGQSVLAFSHYYKIPTDHILILHDDLDFPPGRLRIKKGGGDGKHNGLKDIISHLGTPQFWRLRIGIGHPGTGQDVAAYVLNPPIKEEETAILQKLPILLDLFPLILNKEMEKVTQQLHTLT